MKTRIWFLISAASVLLLAGCNIAPEGAQDTRDADAKAIRQIEANWSELMSTRNVDKISGYYADNACMCRTGVPLVYKKANIVTLLRKLMLDPNYNFSFTNNKVVVSQSGDMAYTQGVYNMRWTSQQTKKIVSEQGKYMIVYMKQDDKTWKAVADTANADSTPLPGDEHKLPPPNR